MKARAACPELPVPICLSRSACSKLPKKPLRLHGLAAARRGQAGVPLC